MATLRRGGKAAASMAAAAADSGGGGGGGEKTIALVGSDNSARFEVREAAALLSQTVRRKIDEAAAAAGADAIIRLPNVDAKTLAKVLEYCNKHAPAAAEAEADAPPAAEGGEDLERFDREFVNVDTGTLVSLVKAASYLKIEGLLSLTCQTVADMIKGKTPEQVTQMIGSTSAFTPEEEDEFRRLVGHLVWFALCRGLCS